MKLPKYIPTYENFRPGKDQVFYSGPYWGQAEIDAGIKALTDGKWITSGGEVAKFEKKFCRKFSVKHSLMVNSGSSANLVMIAAVKKFLGWKDDSQVIVSPVGFPTTIAPIVQNKLRPVFIDIEMDTLNFDLKKIVEKINPKTVAILVSPVLGNPPDMDALRKIAQQNNLILLGDNCDSLGSTWEGEPITNFYYAWTCSFYPAHHICTGEGGMVCSDSETLIDTARSIAWWGRDCYCVGNSNQLPCGTCGKRFDKWLPNYDGVIDHKYLFTEMGYNLKPLDLQGAIGIVQLDRFEDIHANRVHNFSLMKFYIEDNIKGAKVAHNLPSAEPSWFGVPVICENQSLKETLVRHFEENHIQTRNYFAGNILMHPGYEKLDNYENYPNANRALPQVFFLGNAPMYTKGVLDYIEEVCIKFQGSQV